MLDPANPILKAFLQQGCKVSVQAHVATGRPLRYTAIARRPDGTRLQGWGSDASAALCDMARRAKADRAE